MTDPRIKRLLEVYSYDRETGCFFNKRGKKAGWTKKNGYKLIRFEGSTYRQHRLIWMIEKGQMPSKDIDHIDGVPGNNVITNLRLATAAENGQSIAKRKRNTSGLTGASWHIKAKKWQSKIRHDGKQTYLGLFDTKEQAHEAYLTAKKKFHKFQGTLRDNHSLGSQLFRVDR